MTITKLLLSLVTFAALSAVSNGAQADAPLTPQEAYQAGNDASFAFQCAQWANVDGGRSIKPDEIIRLTNYGYDRGLASVAYRKDPAFLQSLHGKEPLNIRAPLDFWVGAMWVQANETINRALEHDVPNGDHPFAELQELRAASASANFFKQGCDQLGL